MNTAEWEALQAGLEWKPGWRPSNGTEGRLFVRNNCDLCQAEHWSHDGTMEPPDGKTWCPIYNQALYTDRTEAGPAEWEDAQHPEGWFIQRCTALVRCSCPDYPAQS